MFGTNPDRPIDTSSFLTNQPPAVENGSLRDFILLNILTCGIYGSFETLTKKNRVTHLQVHESNLQKEASRIFAIFQNLDNRIQSIQKNVLGAASHTDSIDTSLVEIQETNKNLRSSTRLNLESPLSSFASFVMEWILNIGTLGIYTIYQNNLLNKQIHQLQHLNLSVERVLNSEIDLKQKQVASKIEQVKKNLSYGKILDLCNQPSSTFLEQAEALHEKVQTRENSLKRLQINRDELAKQKADLQQTYPSGQDLESTLKKVKKAHPNVVEYLRLKKTLQKERESHQTLLISAQEKQQIDLIKAGKTNRLRHPSSLPSRDDLRLESIEEEYLDADRDLVKRIRPSLKGDYGLNEGETISTLFTDYVKRYRNTLVPEELIKKGVEHVLDELLQLGTDPQSDIIFNSSAYILYPQYLPNKMAVYQLLVFEFLLHGSIRQDCNGYYLKLALGDALMMRPSNPVRVGTYHNGEFCTKTILKHIDAFSPPSGTTELMYGIDPVRAKQVLSSLSDEQKEFLREQIMSPYMPDSSRRDRELKNFVAGLSADEKKIFQLAYKHITEIALSITNNFEAYVGPTVWQIKMDEWDEDVKPLAKEQVPFDVEDVTPNPIVPWQINETILKRYPMLYEGIKEAQACYAKLQLAQMDESYLSNPLNQAYPAQWRNRQYGSTSKGLSSQYYGSHELLEANQTTGCLFSNLLAILMIKKENVSLSMLRNLKQAIADSLDDPTLAKEFEERIKSNYSQGSKIKTVSDYQKWLRGDSQFTIDQCSEIEIELTARLVGIKIGVFVLNRPTELDAQGLMIPSGPESYFGPNTQERYYLYNHTGMSYYGLFPIYKSSLSFWSLNDLVGDVEAAEIREAINTSHTYWLSLRRANEN